MILVTRFKTKNNFKYSMNGGFSEAKAKQEKINMELVEQIKSGFVALFRDYYTNQDFLPYNEFNTQAKIDILFANKSTELGVLTFINEELYKCTATRTKSRAEVRSRVNHMQKMSKTIEFKTALSEAKDELIAMIESNGITFEAKVDQNEPNLQSQIADARQEISSTSALESEEPQFPDLRAKIDRAIDYIPQIDPNRTIIIKNDRNILQIYKNLVIFYERTRANTNTSKDEHRSLMRELDKDTHLAFSKKSPEEQKLIMDQFPKFQEAFKAEQARIKTESVKPIEGEVFDLSIHKEEFDLITSYDIDTYDRIQASIDFYNKHCPEGLLKKPKELNNYDDGIYAYTFTSMCLNTFLTDKKSVSLDQLNKSIVSEKIKLSGKLTRLEGIHFDKLFKQVLGDQYACKFPQNEVKIQPQSSPDQAPKPNTLNPFAQSVLDGLTQYSQEGRVYIRETYSKEIRNSNSNRGRSKLMQVLEADVRLNDFLVPADVKVENETKLLTFAEKIQSAVTSYNKFKQSFGDDFETRMQIDKILIFKLFMFCKEEFLEFVDHQHERPDDIKIVLQGDSDLNNIKLKSEAEFNRYSPFDQNTIMQAFPDRELTPKTPETKIRTLDLKNYAKDLEAIKKEYNSENYKNYYELMWSFYRSKLNNIVVFYENCGSSNEALFIFTFVESLANSYDSKIQNNELLSIAKSIEKTQDAVKKFTPEEVKKFDLQYKEFLGENYLTISEVKEIENYEVLVNFIINHISQFNNIQLGEIMKVIDTFSASEVTKLINDIGKENKRKSAKYKIGQIIASIQGFDDLKPIEPTETSSQHNPNNPNENPPGTSSNQNEDTGNSGGNNNLPPNRPKTAESNEDKSFDEQFRSLLEFINQNFDKDKDEFVSSLLTYCFTSA
jgi:hypothetical protein